MTQYGRQRLRTLIGLDRMPKFGKGIPAAWWVSTDEEQIHAYDRWSTDRDDYHRRVADLEKSLGLPEGSGRINSFGKSTVFTGFTPAEEMTLWSGHPDHAPTPAGWRIDSKSGYLVPVRRTKSDRESQANQDFAAIKRAPTVAAYLSGMPEYISLHDSGMGGGTMYSIHYRRGVECLMAFCGGDPLRADEPVHVDEAIWHQQKLSVLLALSEDRDAAVSS